MKKILIIGFILSIIFVFSTCQKEEIETNTTQTTSETDISLPSSIDGVVSPRSGFVDVIFYRTSLTTDNYLLSQTPNFNRTYNLFNKTKIDSVKFVATGKGSIFADRIVQKHYEISIFYKQNQIPYKFTAFSKSNSDNFTYIPTNSTQLLTNSNTAKIMTFEIQKSASVKYNYWDGTTKVYNFVKITKDGMKGDTRVLDPLNKDSNIFVLPHVH